MRLHRSLIAFAALAGLAQAPVVAQVAATRPAPASTAPASSAPATSTPATSTPAPSTPAPATAAPATASPAAAPAAAPARRARKTLEERFQVANTTHDGKLTLEQARAGRLNAVARDFAVIDKDKRGSVTLDQIKAHQAETRAASRARRAAAPAH